MNRITRRTFLAAASSAAALAAAPIAARAQTLPARDAFKMKLGFMSSIAQDKTLPELIELAVTHGYQGVEFRPEWKQAHGVELSMTPAQRKEARARFADRGIEISAISPGVKFLNDDRDRQLEILLRYIELASDLGAPCIRIFADPLPEDPAQRRESHKVQAEYQARAAQRAWEAGVLLALETHSNSIGVDAGEMMRLAGYPPAFRVNWHLAHSLNHGEDVETAYRHVKGRVVHAHFSFPEDPEEMKALERQFELLLYDGFEGFFSVEMINKTDNTIHTAQLIAHAEKWRGMKARFGV
jgi:sugar phosphate isomerase/epimerase